MNLKVLTCPYSSRDVAFMAKNHRLKAHPVVLGRPGLYRKEKDCWFELDGQAWEFDPVLFNTMLANLDIQVLNQEDVRTIQAIMERYPKLISQAGRDAIREAEIRGS